MTGRNLIDFKLGENLNISVAASETSAACVNSVNYKRKDEFATVDIKVSIKCKQMFFYFIFLAFKSLTDLLDGFMIN